jgi:hypothetical protein
MSGVGDFLLGSFPRGRKLETRGDRPENEIGSFGWAIAAEPGNLERAVQLGFRERDPREFRREGRRDYVEAGTGEVYRRVPGNPLLSEGGIGTVCFIREAGALTFLRPRDEHGGTSTFIGTVRGARVA